MSFIVEILSHRGMAISFAMLLSAMMLEVTELSMMASVCFVTMLVTRTQPPIYLLVAVSMPWVLKSLLLGGWAPWPSVDFVFLSVSAVVYIYSKGWMDVLERLSFLAFIIALCLYVYRGYWAEFIKDNDLHEIINDETITFMVGFIALKIDLLVALLLFFCARWSAVILDTLKIFRKKFIKPSVSLWYVILSLVVLVLSWVLQVSALALPMILPFLYVGHVHMLKWTKVQVPRSWKKPTPVMFYYLVFFMVLLTDVLLVVLVPLYMGLGIYQSFRNYRGLSLTS